MTRAAITRWTMNWYECSWSCRDGIDPSEIVVSAPYDMPQVALAGGGVRLGTRVVLAQTAIAVSVAAWVAGPYWALVALPVALAAVVPAAGGALPRRLGDTFRFRGRRRMLPAGAGAAELLTLVRPGAATTSIEVDGADVGVFEDTDGLAAVVRVGDLTALLGDVMPPVPALSSLLPAPARDVPEVRLQLLVTAVTAPGPAAGASPAATSYRQLTDGRVLAHQRVLIGVRVRRAGGFRRPDLEEALTVAVRRVCRLLVKAGLPARPLSAASALAALAEAAHHDPAHPVREAWTGVQAGGLQQAVFRLERWPDQARLTGPLLRLPTSGTAVSLTATSRSTEAEVTVRLAAPTAAALAGAVTALDRLVSVAQARVRRLDGAQLDGFAATLPLGGGASSDDAALAGLVAGHDTLVVGGGRTVHATAVRLAEIEPPIGGEGLMLGRNRHGEPVVVRLFRAEPTRAALIGGLRCAELLVLRALAVGAQVIVQSTRPHAWEPFLRGLGSGEPVTLAPAGRITEPPAPTSTRPQLLIVDVGPVSGRGAPVVERAWRATLLVRDELTPADGDLLARVDLALLQPLSPPEATLAARALGLGESAGWLTRIGPEMLGVVVSRHTVRWTRLSTTPIERQLTGGPVR
ncbi:hypothetical protein GCM10010399_65740 [Dactylosporangium fulvum]